MNDRCLGERWIIVSMTASRTTFTRPQTPLGSGLIPSWSRTWKITLAIEWLSMSRAPVIAASSLPIVYFPTAGGPIRWKMVGATGRFYGARVAGASDEGNGFISASLECVEELTIGSDLA